MKEATSHRCANCGAPLLEETMGEWIVSVVSDHLVLFCGRQCEEQFGHGWITLTLAGARALAGEQEQPCRTP